MKTERDITLEAWLSALAPAHGILLDTLVPASSDAGFRRYFRVGTSSGGTLIVMDAPPCGAFEDVFLMEEYADGVLFVVKQDHASQGQILGAVAELEAGDLPIIGYVFNGVSGVFSPYSYGKYGRYGKYRTYGHYKVYGEEKRPTGKDRET